MMSILSLGRRPNAGRRRSHVRPRFTPSLASLECRTLLSVAADAGPTAAEQYMLQLVNNARANPQAEAARLTSLAQTDPILKSAVGSQGVNLTAFNQLMNSYGPLPPLAFNTRLIQAALDHDVAMVSANSQVHSPTGYLTDPSVAKASDGQVYYGTGTGAWATGENIFAYSQAETGQSQQAFINYFYEGFMLDWGNPGFGHLKSIMAPGPGEATPTGHPAYSEIGIGLLENAQPTAPSTLNGLNVGPDVMTQEFGWKAGNAFLTGVAFADANGDHSYEIGEGLGGVTITAVGQGGQGTYAVQTWSSGGYSLALPAGTYTVTATGNLAGPQTVTVTIGQDNVGWNVLSGASTPASPTTGSGTPVVTPTAPVTSTPTPSPVQVQAAPSPVTQVKQSSVQALTPRQQAALARQEAQNARREAQLARQQAQAQARLLRQEAAQARQAAARALRSHHH